MVRQRLNIPFVLSLVVLSLGWYFLSSKDIIDSLFLPTPGQMLGAVRTTVVSATYLTDVGASMYRVIVAFGLSLVLAVPIALLMSSYKFINRLVSPYIDFIRYLPVPALIPLTILFFGIGENAKIILLFIGTFFQLILLIIDDLADVHQEYFDLSYTLKFSKIDTLVLKLRAILPQLYNNARITLGWCWTYVIIAELVAANAGIGHMIKEAQRFSNTPGVYIGVVTMGLIGFFTDSILKWLYPYFFKYQQKSTEPRL